MQPDDLLPVDRFRLSNGLTGMSVSMPHLHSVELAVHLRVGSRNDPPGKEGLSHIVEHMLFRGCEGYPATIDLESAFEEIGGSVNAATDEESTCYFSRVHPDRIEEGLSLFSAMIRSPLFRGEDLEIEKRIVVEEALEDLNERGEEINPHTIAARTVWGDGPLGHPTIGTPQSVERVTAEDLGLHAQRFHLPSNAVVIAAGRVDPERFRAALLTSFGDWEGGVSDPPPPSPVRLRGPELRFVHDSDSQVHLLLSFFSLCRSDPRLSRLRLLRRILAGGGSSRLHLRLREELGVIYSVDATITAHGEGGSFGIELFTAPEHLPLVVSTTLEELSRLVSTPLPADEMERVRRGILYDLEYAVDSPYEIQSRYGWGELMGVPSSIGLERMDVERVEPGMLSDLAREILSPRRMVLVAVGPVDDPLRVRIAEMVRKWEAGTGQGMG